MQLSPIAASIFDHPAILLLIVFVSLVRWLISKTKAQAGETQTQTPVAPPSQPITRGGETQTEEERIRKFLEALGQPRGSTPPKVTPRPRPVVPKIFPRLPPLKTAPPPLPAEPFVPVPPPLPVQSMSARSAPDFEVREVLRQTSSEPVARPAAVRFDPRIKLGTPQDLRTAIILREIFGPPRSLQPVDLTSAL
ncbi:MAG: hypothetical protein QOH01_2850 [Verrucomicrobiota bacterium]|jgi:hypothetical protein